MKCECGHEEITHCGFGFDDCHAGDCDCPGFAPPAEAVNEKCDTLPVNSKGEYECGHEWKWTPDAGRYVCTVEGCLGGSKPPAAPPPADVSEPLSAIDPELTKRAKEYATIRLRGQGEFFVEGLALNLIDFALTERRLANAALARSRSGADCDSVRMPKEFGEARDCPICGKTDGVGWADCCNITKCFNCDWLFYSKESWDAAHSDEARLKAAKADAVEEFVRAVEAKIGKVYYYGNDDIRFVQQALREVQKEMGR